MISFVGFWRRLDTARTTHSTARRMLDATPAPPSSVVAWASNNGVDLAFRDSRHSSAGRTLANNRVSDPVLVGDVRIDNRDELAARLDTPLPDDDHELVLALYRRYGTGTAAMLVGDFSFAIYDPARNYFYCARDPIGVRSFYYHASAEIFAFAPSSHGLRVVRDIPSEIDQLRVADYLVSLYEDPSATFYQGILRLPAAHWMVVTPTRLTIERYWSLDHAREIPGSTEEYVEGFRSHFTRAVEDRVRGERSLSSTLSGGLDSSSVAVVARRCMESAGGNLHLLSALFDSVPESDEREYIDAVVAEGGMVPHRLAADRIGPLDDLDTLLREQGEPFFAPNLFIHRALMREGVAAGAEVMLDGLDGDTTVSHGLAWLLELARHGRIVRLRKEIQGVANRDGVRSPREIWYRSIVRPLLLRRPREVVHRLRGGVEPPWGVEALVAPELVRRFRLVDRYRDLAAVRMRTARSQRGDHAQRLEWPLHPFILEVLQRSGTSLGIESRYPFYDQRLIEYSLALPAETKLRDGLTRWVLRQSMAGLLPEKVRLRPGKSNLGHNFERAFGNHCTGEIDRLVAEPGALADYVDMKRMRLVSERFRKGEASSGEILALWNSVTLGVWLDWVGRGGCFV